MRCRRSVLGEGSVDWGNESEKLPVGDAERDVRLQAEAESRGRRGRGEPECEDDWPLMSDMISSYADILTS